MDLRGLDDAFAGLLASGEGSRDEYLVLELPSPATARVAVDPWGRRHILFPSEADRAIRPDTRSSGVQIVPRDLLVDGVLRPFVDLACLDARLNHVFTAVAVEALGAADGMSAPDLAASVVLDRWRELFRNPPAGGLSQSARMGLFGELTLLEELSSRSVNAVGSWAGPAKGRHDFVSDGIDIEVKTTFDRGMTALVVHGVDQLATPPDGRLLLVVYVVEKVPAGGDTLQDLVSRIHALGVQPVELYDRLDAAGVSAADLLDDQTRLRVKTRRAFLVDRTFPRLTAQAFHAWPVAGVVGLQYQIEPRGGTCSHRCRGPERPSH